MARTRPVPQVLLLVCGIVLLQGLLVAWFTWPTTSASPHRLPVVVAGPAEATAGVAGKLTAQDPGAFQVRTVADAQAADRALRDRRAYAAIIVDRSGLAVHVASAASPTVAAEFTAMARQLGNGGPAPVTDVVPTDSRDPRGAAMLLGLLPFVLASLIAGAVLGLLVAGRLARVLLLAGYAVLAGLAGAAVLVYWLGVLPGGYLWDAAVFALFAAAVAGAVGGLGALLGTAGVGLGVLATFVFANPISGLIAAPELVPAPWGRVGQDLPVGAAGSLLRSVAYFDGAGWAAPALVLGVWAVGGAVLLLASPSRARPAGEPGTSPVAEVAAAGPGTVPAQG